MISSIISWLTTEGISLILGFATRAIIEYFQQRRNEQAIKDAARLETERDQAREGERVQGELADEAAKRVEPDEAIKRLQDGTA